MARKSNKRVSAADFGATPNDGQNDAAALRKAVEHCRLNPGTTLYFAPGVYDFRDEKAVQLMNDAMGGKLTKNPQDTVFKPYFPYVKGLDFNGARDVTVEADGAILLCDGWMEPVSLENCKNVKLKGLTVDYKRKPYSVGKIIDVQSDWFDVEFDGCYPMDGIMHILRMKFWDVKSHRLLPREDYSPDYKRIAPQRWRISLKIAAEMKENLIITPHGFHFRPAILIQETENTRLEDVTIRSQPGMGIVSHRSKDINLTGLRIVPAPGGVLSTNTDATHFTSCTGLIRFENCQFEGHGDDATNLHNYYYTIQKPANGKGYDLVVKNADLHAMVLDYPDPGDTLELVDRSTLTVLKTFVVKTRENNIPEFRSQVTLNEELPPDLENYYLVNCTRLPKVEIVGCTMTGNRSRGIMIKTRNVLIEKCLIRETTGTGIHVGAEASWHEGPACADVTIRYNRIIRCGTGAGTIDDTCGIAICISAPDTNAVGLHKRILIEGNIIEGENAKNGIYISGASDVIVRYNEIAGCETPVKVRYTDNVDVHSNPGAADLIVKSIR